MNLIRPIAPALYRPLDPFRLGEKIARYHRKDRKLWAGAGDRSYAFDANMALSDGAAAITATGYSQAQGADGFVDLGGNQGVTITLPSIADVSSITPQQARIDAMLAMWVTAIKTSSGNELYKFVVTGSNDAAFGAGNCFMLAMFELGHVSVLDTFNGATTAAPAAVGGSMYEVPFAAEQNNVKFQFLKLRMVLSGTTPSITFKANVVVLPEP